ncbi:RES family NAD+ phosphorylase [Arenibacterium sp. CAU 1754]
MTAADLRGFPRIPAPEQTHRVIPSRFPPVPAFDTVASAEDLDAVIELEGWTNDRLVEYRLRRLAPSDWVFGRANSSVVMAAFLHGSPTGSRFAAGELGAWYSAASEQTALIEVLNGLRREVVNSALSEKTEEYRTFNCRLDGTYVNIRQKAPALHDPDSYALSQVFGENVRATGLAGISYDSVRDAGGWNFVCYHPALVQDVVQAAHWRARVGAQGKVFVEKLSSE